MARRMIDAAIWRSETIARLTRPQRLTLIGMISNADDQGRLQGHPSLLRSMLYPFDDIQLSEIEAEIQAIASGGTIHLYEVNGCRYIQLVNWWRYQSPAFAWPSRWPAPEGWVDRERFRRGNDVVVRNWDTDPTVAPQWPHSDPTLRPAPSISGSTSDSGRENSSDSDEPGGVPPRDAAPTVPVLAAFPVQETTPIQENPEQKPVKSREKPAREPKRSLHPALAAYREEMHLFPLRQLQQDIIDAVGENPANLERWRKTLHAWIAAGWKPTNVGGMLDCYRRGEIPGTSPGRNGNGKAPPRDADADVEAVYLALAQSRWGRDGPAALADPWLSRLAGALSPVALGSLTETTARSRIRDAWWKQKGQPTP